VIAGGSADSGTARWATLEVTMLSAFTFRRNRRCSLRLMRRRKVKLGTSVEPSAPAGVETETCGGVPMSRHRLAPLVAVVLLAVMPIRVALAQGSADNSLSTSASTAPPPPTIGHSSPPLNAPLAVRGVVAEESISTTGLAKPAADGATTRIVPARPCSTAARETDGTTTCVGIPDRH
jgi:hypothetical protein